MNIATFNEKYNLLDENVYTVEEAVNIVNGVYENVLIHDNVTKSTINVYTGSQLTGDKITTYFLSTPSKMPWKTSIKILCNTCNKLYITYETVGDQIEAEDINNLQNGMVDTQKALNEEIVRATNKEDQIENNLNTEITRAKQTENDLSIKVDDEQERARIAETSLSQQIIDEKNRATVSENNIVTTINTNKPKWDEAYTERHIHTNKNILDGLNNNSQGQLTFNGNKISTTTINGISDDILIEGGNNVSISKSGNTIIVSSVGGQEKIVINTPISILSTDWILDTSETPNCYTININHGLNDNNIIVAVYKDNKYSDSVEVDIIDNNNIMLTNYEAINCKIVINSSGQPTEVIDNLNSIDSTKALSAKQGQVLKGLIDEFANGIVIGTTYDTAQPVNLFFKIIG